MDGLDSRTKHPPRYPWIGKKPFYGWIITIIGAFSQFFQGTSTLGFSTYLGPLQNDFGWNKATLAGPRSVTQVEGALTGPLEGWLVDKFGPRRVVTAGIIITGLGFLLFGLTDSLWMFYLSNVVIALGTGLAGLLVMSVVVNNWFRRKRTIAQSVMGLGYSLAGVIAVPALVFIQAQSGWRDAAYYTAFVIWGVGIPAAQLLRSLPEDIGLMPDGAAATDANRDDSAWFSEYDFTLQEGIKSSAFWILAAASAISNIAIIGVQVHLFLHLEGVGLSRATVAAVMTVASVTNIPFRLIGGFFGDRFDKKIVLGLSMVFMAVSMYVLAVATTPVMAYTYAVLFGIGWGIRTPVLNAIQGEYFGRRSQGIIRGLLQAFSLPINMAAPVVAGLMADIQGTYTPTFIVIGIIKLAGALSVFLMRRPMAPGRRA